MEKRGPRRLIKAQANIIALVLIILIILVAIVIIWNVISFFIRGSSEEVDVQPFHLSGRIESFEASGDSATVKVKRGARGGEIKGIKLIFKDADGKLYSYENRADIPNELETKSYSITLYSQGLDKALTSFSGIKKVSLYYIYKKKGEERFTHELDSEDRKLQCDIDNDCPDIKCRENKKCENRECKYDLVNEGSNGGCLAGEVCDGSGNCVDCINPQDCDDGIGCTNENCVNNQCIYVGDDNECSIGEFCNVNIGCQIPSLLNCNECGKGLANFCDRAECERISEGCYFIDDGIIRNNDVGSCYSCSSGSCSDYGYDSKSCSDNVCGFTGCGWDVDSCRFCTTQTWYKDADGDGYSDGTTLTQCNRPTNYKLATELIQTFGDCNDDSLTGVSIYPGATERCDGKDNDCNPNTFDGSGENPPLNDKQADICTGSRKSCTNGNWVNDYSGIQNYESSETSCSDGKDNDCDEAPDCLDSDCFLKCQQELDNNLVSFWLFEEDFNDGKGDNHGIPMPAGSSPQIINDAERGNVIKFNDNYLNLKGFRELDGKTAFTISFWIKPDEIPFLSYQGIFARGSGKNPEPAPRVPWIYGLMNEKYLGMQIYTTSSNNIACGTISGTDDPNTHLIQGQWHHIVAVWDGSYCKFYVNKQQSGLISTSIGNTLANTDDTGVNDYSFIGYINNFDEFKGSLDEVRVYKKALTRNEIEFLFNSQNK